MSKRMTKTYYVHTVATTAEDKITCDKIGEYADAAKAFSAAKHAARTRKEGIRDGHNSLAYVGREMTAFVSW